MTADAASIPAAPIVYIVDDDPSIRAALEDLLASVGLAATLFGSTRAFLEAAPADAPGCLVLDVRMPGQSGMEFHGQMVERGNRLPVVFVTGHGDIAMSVRAMKAGAIEFLAKPFDNQELLDAIHRGIALDEARRAEDRHRATLKGRFDALADGEKAVMAGVVKGLLNKQIAGMLGVSEITVKVRRRQAMLKMGAKSLPELVRMSDALAIGSWDD
ncbi:response regulator transcription factor [Sphingomonas morindae]|uniref:Response regulator n=1 Tax=Sphingomonas morindae TaxID=1541170 RepID=A0ABY4XCI7_9SPHN|nr:response regulator [Sphingomonas morindae]USI74672.1 response regulator [Sphingomonas morindae]